LEGLTRDVFINIRIRCKGAVNGSLWSNSSSCSLRRPIAALEKMKLKSAGITQDRRNRHSLTSLNLPWMSFRFAGEVRGVLMKSRRNWDTEKRKLPCTSRISSTGFVPAYFARTFQRGVGMTTEREA